MPLSRDLNLLWTVSRPEFIPANSASLFIGVAWALHAPFLLVQNILIPAVLAYLVITLVAAFAAQINTLSDLEYDRTDPDKQHLVQVMDTLGKRRVHQAMGLELVLSLVFLAILIAVRNEPVLSLFWIAGVFFAYSYSAPPLRFKSRSWQAMGVLLLVLSLIPISFVYLSLGGRVQPAFLVFLAGQALTVCGVIVPAEIRDYFTDRARGVVTFTVQLGLVRASRLALVLLVVGGTLCGIGFLADFLRLGVPYAALSLLLLALLYGTVIRQYIHLYRLSRSYHEDQTEGIDQQIVELASNNPTWITLVSQSIVIVCLVQIVAQVWIG